MRLRTCPVCRSKAVSAVERGEDGDGAVRVEVRCGECGTWRGGALGRRAVRALEKRLRRDRRQIELSIGQGDRWREYELAALMQGPPRGARRKTHR
jgi:hypothetical protein